MVVIVVIGVPWWTGNSLVQSFDVKLVWVPKSGAAASVHELQAVGKHFWMDSFWQGHSLDALFDFSGQGSACPGSKQGMRGKSPGSPDNKLEITVLLRNIFEQQVKLLGSL